MSAAANIKVSKKELIGWIVTIFCVALVMLGFNDGTTLNSQQTLFFAITLFYILITAFELLPNMAIAVLLPFTYLFFNLATAANIFSSWSNNVVWMCLGGMWAANILARIGLLRRMVIWCITHLGYSYRRLVLGFAVAGILLTVISPSG